MAARKVLEIQLSASFLVVNQIFSMFLKIREPVVCIFVNKEKYEQQKIYHKMASAIFGEEIVEFNIDDIPKISIITSVYDGDDYIESFLEDITRQTIFKDKCELIMVNANSPGNPISSSMDK